MPCWRRLRVWGHFSRSKPTGEDTLRQELEASFRNRADLYRLMHTELVAELGLERGEALIIVPGGGCCHIRLRDAAPST